MAQRQRRRIDHDDIERDALTQHDAEDLRARERDLDEEIAELDQQLDAIAELLERLEALDARPD